MFIFNGYFHHAHERDHPVQGVFTVLDYQNRMDLGVFDLIDI